MRVVYWNGRMYSTKEFVEIIELYRFYRSFSPNRTHFLFEWHIWKTIYKLK